MLSCLVLWCVLTAAAGELRPELRYHETEGIPKYEAIRQSEEAEGGGPGGSGGQFVDAGTHPYLGGIIIVLTDGRRSICGCSLLTQTDAVTAAHCWSTSSLQARRFTVVYGSSRLNRGGTRINTSRVTTHPDYDTSNLNNDVAIIRHRRVTFNNNIRSINLPTGSSSYVGIWAKASGFGIDDNSSAFNPGKRQVELLVITNDQCRETFSAKNIVASTLCVSTTHGSSTCSGDSGGPLAIGSSDNRTLIGITSFGAESCTDGFPVGFARVTSFATWIREQL